VLSGFTHKNGMALLVPIKKTTQPAKRRKKKDARVALNVNTIIDGYRIGKVIGRGSFSLVYSAVKMSSGQEVVIKEYFPKYYATRQGNNKIVPHSIRKELVFREGLKQFYSEALAIKNIKHPNVLDACSFSRMNNTAYLISLNLNGRDLKWFVNSFDAALDEALLLKVFLPILSALHYLHKAMLLHLDIKPANILLQPDGQSLLLDFGASQSMNSSKRICKYRTLSHGFAPLEQYDRNRELGPWTDLYAVAASMYYCMAGKMPPKSKNDAAAARLDATHCSAHYHPALISAVNRCLSHDETARFDNVDDFAAAILSGSK
jgi:serine/threonine protein kinase